MGFVTDSELDANEKIKDWILLPQFVNFIINSFLIYTHGLVFQSLYFWPRHC